MRTRTRVDLELGNHGWAWLQQWHDLHLDFTVRRPVLGVSRAPLPPELRDDSRGLVTDEGVDVGGASLAL
jgi:hypothetical protein